MERDANVLREEIAELRHGLKRNLDLDTRLDLVAEEVELRDLLDRIEERRQAVAA
jgi:uncharacterized protein YlaN (UPF0358 family)